MGAPPSLAQVRDLLAGGTALRRRALLGGAATAVALLAFTGGSLLPSQPRETKPAAAGRTAPAQRAAGAPAALPPPEPRALAEAGKPEEEIPLDLGGGPAETEGGGGLRLIAWLSGVALKLGVVLALAYACLAILRRFVPGAAAAVPGADMGIRRTIALGPGRSVHLLEVEGHRILIGSTPHQLSLLADLTDPAMPRDEGEGALDAAPGAKGGFEEQLELLARRAEGAPERALASPAAAPAPRVTDPDTYTDAELREEVRRRLFAVNRSAAGLQKLSEGRQKGERETWPGR